MSNWDRRFAVAISVELTSGKSSVGSGYAIAPNLILTARHVARPAKAKADATPYVHLVNLDRSKHPARLRWAPTTDEDIALLEVEHVIDEKLTPWSILAAHPLDAVGNWQAEGFPRAAIDSEDPLAPAPFEGRIHPSVPRRPQLLLDGVVAPENRDDWGGMSGAGVFVEARLVGVVKRIPPGKMRNRNLAATPISRFLGDSEFRAILGDLPGAGRLAQLEREVIRILQHDDPARAELAALLGLDAASPLDDVARRVLADRRADTVLFTLAKAARRSRNSGASGGGAGPYRRLLGVVLPHCVDWDGVARALDRWLLDGSASKEPIVVPVATCAIAEVLMARARGTAADFVATNESVVGSTAIWVRRKPGMDQDGLLTNKELVELAASYFKQSAPTFDALRKKVTDALSMLKRLSPEAQPYFVVDPDGDGNARGEEVNGLAKRVKSVLTPFVVLALSPYVGDDTAEGGLEFAIREIIGDH